MRTHVSAAVRRRDANPREARAAIRWFGKPTNVFYCAVPANQFTGTMCFVELGNAAETARRMLASPPSASPLKGRHCFRRVTRNSKYGSGRKKKNNRVFRPCRTHSRGHDKRSNRKRLHHQSSRRGLNLSFRTTAVPLTYSSVVYVFARTESDSVPTKRACLFARRSRRKTTACSRPK